MKTSDNFSYIKPIDQKFLYNYNSLFDLFAKLYQNNLLPKTILLSGQKGLGKNTFSFHLINYFLSMRESFPYSLKNHSIDPNNKSYKLISNNLHPNFYLLDISDDKKKIEIDQVRNLKTFLTKTTYISGLKFILINNSESLNLNSANGLLKIIEEPTVNTYFVIVHDSAHNIIPTIKSRCSEFKIFLLIMRKNKSFLIY